MTLEETLQLLVKAPALDKQQLDAVAMAWLSAVARFDEMDGQEQAFFKESYDAALRLLVTRLRSGLDSHPCERLLELVKSAPFHEQADAQRYNGLAESIQLEGIAADTQDTPSPAGPRVAMNVAVQLAALGAAASLQAIRLQLPALATRDINQLDRVVRDLGTLGSGLADQEAA
ncbi:hypothetical protein ACT80S_15660 [Ramlibacter sp. MAHUQ-53]|uniref:hypothetical protein n=1 Tax=unclassified Ramlibacter TaxID=2617605 RepID=UPI003625BB8D